MFVGVRLEVQPMFTCEKRTSSTEWVARFGDDAHGLYTGHGVLTVPLNGLAVPYGRSPM